jgi:serine/threonine-protein kinase
MVDAEAGAAMTHAGTLMGTPAYMSPEACAGERVDARSDVYSLGAVLYYMLTGAELFAKRTVAETLTAHMVQTPDAPSRRLAARGMTIRADLEAVVMRCLAKRREERFASVRELEDALRACGENEGEVVRRSITTRAQQPMARGA